MTEPTTAADHTTVPFSEETDFFPFPNGPMTSPPPEFARRRKECPVGEVTLPTGDKVLLAVRYADIQLIMSDGQKFIRCPAGADDPKIFPNVDVLEDPTMMMNMDGEDHARLRRIIGPAVNPRSVDTWRPEIRTIVHAVLDEMEGHGAPADLMTEFSNKVAIRLLLHHLSLPQSDAERLLGWVTSWLGVDVPEQKAEAEREFTRWIAETAARSRANPGTALIDGLVHADHEGDRMSDDELASMIRSMIAGNIFTMSSAISLSFYTLLRDREHWQMLLENRSLVPAAIEELIRVNPPGGGSISLLRKAIVDVELPSGNLVRAGQWVLTPGVSAVQDPEAFPDPEKFKVDRPKTPSNLVFGAGRHTCPGQHLARAELEIILDTFLERLPQLHMTVTPENLPWDEAGFTIFTVGGLPCLPVAW